ncbi:50S ribosomal protein L29 [Actinomycetaceae bacterium MB13-C1-2]|nr:50S ribosomal protein L29 [Actinomycetaceae bacterium MB13-C1-2]
MADNVLKTADLDAMDDAQLRKELERAKAELFNLRFSQAVGSLEDSGRMKSVRRNIARIYTIARERELGFRTAPGTED